jgi:hypothetical protein
LYVSLSIRDTTAGGLLFSVVPHLLPQRGPSATTAIRSIRSLLIGLVDVPATIVLLLVNGWLLLL